MRLISYLIVFIILIFGITFACLNAETVNINYYVNSIDLPLSIVLVSTFVAGGLFGLLASSVALIKIKKRNFQLGKRIKLKEREIENLRAIPLQDKH